jgi:hypothetical protein
MFKKILSCVGLGVTCRISVTKLHSTPQVKNPVVEIHVFVDAKRDAPKGQTGHGRRAPPGYAEIPSLPM